MFKLKIYLINKYFSTGERNHQRDSRSEEIILFQYQTHWFACKDVI